MNFKRYYPLILNQRARSGKSKANIKSWTSTRSICDLLMSLRETLSCGRALAYPNTKTERGGKEFGVYKSSFEGYKALKNSNIE